MRSVAKRFVCRLLAIADRDALFLGNPEFQRVETGSGMRTVAERFILRESALAPMVFTRGQFDHFRFGIGNMGLGHRSLLAVEIPKN